MELSPTAHVILGMLGFEPMSGYEIKAFVDRSTRFFWAASYGQIYPELRRLAEAGLIEGSEDPRGERQRTVFRLTDAGRAALDSWLADPEGIQEVRDESLLKLFFSEVAGPETTARALAAKRAHHLDLAARLRTIEASKPDKSPRSSTYITLRFGIAFNDFIADWCEREAKALHAAEKGSAKEEKVV